MNDLVEFTALPDGEALDRLAKMIDQAADTRDGELTDKALSLSKQLSARSNLTGEQRVLLHYFRANAFETQLDLADQGRSWAWDVPHLQNVLLELRRAVRDEAFAKLNPFRQCQIYTNLGNKLNSIGRPVEALMQWDRAIALNPNFAMALGNRGHGLVHYGEALYDSGHHGLFLLSAHDSFVAASADGAIFDSPVSNAHRAPFSAIAGQIAERLDLDTTREFFYREFSLGRSTAERAYRSWCLKNRLFLNPLNDLGVFSIAAHDVLHLPSLTISIDEGGAGPPAVFGFYNQLKQEFISARWLCYEGLTEQRAHFSDRDTHLYDTLSIPSYSLATEKTKLAFRMSYSLFDKIAFFINDYFKVGLAEREVSFRSVWYERKGKSKPLSSIFLNRPNWPLRGLYWLSKDLYEPAFEEVSEPDAEGLANLRHHLEHKYCQVYEDLCLGYSQFATAQYGSTLGFRIGRDMLDAKTLHLLKLARATLIYLSLAVYGEEAARNAERGDGLIAPMPLWMWQERRRL